MLPYPLESKLCIVSDNSHILTQKQRSLYAWNAYTSIDVHFVIHSFSTNETLPQKALKHETIDKNDFYDPFYSIHDQSLCCKLLTLMRMVLIGLYALCFSKAYNCYLYLGQKVSSIHMRTCVSFWNDLQSFFRLNVNRKRHTNYQFGAAENITYFVVMTMKIQ